MHFNLIIQPKMKIHPVSISHYINKPILQFKNFAAKSNAVRYTYYILCNKLKRKNIEFVCLHKMIKQSLVSNKAGASYIADNPLLVQ